MKKLATLMTAVVLVMMSVTMVSCGDSDDYDYYFDLDRALTEYFNRYGDFGTDDRTTADWFDHYYPYASDYDYRSFINAVNADINNSRTTMARYLNGEWEGPLRMYFKNQAGQTVYTDYQVIWHFELSASSDVKGRGTEYRYNEDEGETRTNFSWCVNGYGGIEISYDPSQPGQDPVNMLIAYNNLDKLSTTHFKGTSVGVNIEEEDDFNLTKRLPQRIKGETTAAPAGKTFGGKQADGKTAPVERNITIKSGHRSTITTSICRAAIPMKRGIAALSVVESGPGAATAMPTVAVAAGNQPAGVDVGLMTSKVDANRESVKSHCDIIHPSREMQKSNPARRPIGLSARKCV